jgi:hypothetical protein
MKVLEEHLIRECVPAGSAAVEVTYPCTRGPRVCSHDEVTEILKAYGLSEVDIKIAIEADGSIGLESLVEIHVGRCIYADDQFTLTVEKGVPVDQAESDNEGS